MLAAVLLSAPLQAVAGERQIRPFVGVTFGGSTTIVPVASSVPKPHGVIGASAVWLGEFVGVDVDFAHVPGFFQSGERALVLDSRVTTLMGNVVVAPGSLAFEIPLNRRTSQPTPIRFVRNPCTPPPTSTAPIVSAT